MADKRKPSPTDPHDTDEPSVNAIAQAVAADGKADRAKPAEAAPSPKEPSVPAASATTTSSPAKQAPAKKTPAKKGSVKKAAAAPVAAKKPVKAPPAPAVKKTTGTPDKTVSVRTDQIPQKEPKMADQTTETVTNAASDMANTAQARMKDAYEKGTEMTSELVAFQKANAEAAIESGKIMFAGMRDMSQTAMEDGKKATEQSVADMKAMAAVKNPTELVQLQGEIARRNLDAVMQYSSKATESWMKLANDAFAPLSSRMSVAADKVAKAA